MTVRGRVNIESNQLFLNGKHIRDYFLPAGTTEIDHALKATKLDNDMTVAAAHCSAFEGRSDISIFNMINYQSCENCRHLALDDRCRFQGKKR